MYLGLDLGKRKTNKIICTLQCVRIYAFSKWSSGSGESGDTTNTSKCLPSKPISILILALLLQLYILIRSGMWFDISLDFNSHNSEWSVFAVVLVFGFVNPATYSVVKRGIVLVS